MLRLLVITSLLVSFPASASSLNKCIDAQGNTTYSNLPCKNSRESHKVSIDPAPVHVSVPSTAAKASAPAHTPAPATTDTSKVKVETRPSSGKILQASASKCEKLDEKMGSMFDTMDKARRSGYTQDQMNAWNAEIRNLEQQKQRSGCF
jgi:hypothetical protein